MKISIVILTFNRRASVANLLEQLGPLCGPLLEVVVVDNGSADGTAALVTASFPWVRLIPLPTNLGVGARNQGIQAAEGEVILSLDDDMCDLDHAALDHVRARFATSARLGALCFKVTWPRSNRVRDWVHRRPSSHSESVFPTYEITEGAVAWRKAALEAAGPYRNDFFISHEGVELAYRLLDAGWDIEYDGGVQVGHDHAQGGRPGWRRYYFDTRNLLWLAVLHQPWSYAGRFVPLGLGAMLVYSIRDGHFLTWLRAVRDGLQGVPPLLRERTPWTERTRNYILEVDSWRPPLWKLAAQRLKEKDFRME